MKAFVTDGDQRAALAITRSLGRRGISVLVGEHGASSLASSSRYCARHVAYPSPEHDVEAFQRFLADFVRRERVDVVVPVTDATTSSVCLSQDNLARDTAVAAPTFEAFDRMTDKASTLRAAAGCGIPIPRTLFVDGRGGLGQVIDQVEYPAVVKPVRSRIRTARGWRATAVRYATSEAGLQRLFEESDDLASHPSLIQPRIAGPGVGLFALFDHGRLLTTFAHRRLREKPPSGGVSVLCESVAVEPELREDAVRLLGPLGWHGVAMLEYKRDRHSGRRFLIEVNGRYWGSLQLAIDAGVDFPHLGWQLALGRRPDLPRSYAVGVKNRWLLGDLDHLLSRLLARSGGLALPEGAPSRWRTLVDFIECSRPGLRDQVRRADDPGPFRYELRRYAGSLATAFAARGRQRASRVRLAGARLARPSIPS
jgi:predicted ATP-grasp superfamily ATP-dependent carboligase